MNFLFESPQRFSTTTKTPPASGSLIIKNAESRAGPKFEYCECHSVVPTKRTTSNGVVVVTMQCEKCGRNKGNKKKADFVLDELPEFNEELRKNWNKSVSDYWEKQRAKFEEKNTEQDSWWEKYNDYLKTDRWHSKRLIVIERTNGKCQARLDGCTITATQAHHVTYEHVGNEPLFDLRSVCSSCHEKITEMDRNNKISGKRGTL